MTDSRLAEQQFTSYAERRPDNAGPYLWRVPSSRLPGLTVEFVAHMRMRGAGGQVVLSPSFDYWNGGYVIVPAGTHWAETLITCEPHRTIAARPLGIELIRCPFCRSEPTWQGNESAMYGGVMVGSAPHLWNKWWLECCNWARTPRYDDPRTLAKVRDDLLRPKLEVAA